MRVLEAELGDGQMNETRFIDLESIPLGQQVEGSQDKSNPSAAVIGHEMTGMFEMADFGQIEKTVSTSIWVFHRPRRQTFVLAGSPHRP